MSTQVRKKIGINSIISWGASVVIIGLTFKILHWHGAEYMIAIGLFTESLLFFILGFASMDIVDATAAKPGEKAADINDLLSTAITPEVIKRLSSGFQQFNKTVESVNQVAGAFPVTDKLIKEMDSTSNDMKKFRDSVSSVGSGFDQFNKSLQAVAQATTESQKSVSAVTAASQQAVTQITSASQQAVSQLNSSSQGMIKDFETAGSSMKGFAKNMVDMNASFDQFSKTLASINQLSASSSTMMKEFDAATTGLKAYNKNLTDLSKIYQAQLDAFRKN